MALIPHGLDDAAYGRLLDGQELAPLEAEGDGDGNPLELHVDMPIVAPVARRPELPAAELPPPLPPAAEEPLPPEDMDPGPMPEDFVSDADYVQDILDTDFGGVFRFTAKAAAIQVSCPFHKRSGTTGCKKTVGVDFDD